MVRTDRAKRINTNPPSPSLGITQTTGLQINTLQDICFRDPGSHASDPQIPNWRKVVIQS